MNSSNNYYKKYLKYKSKYLNQKGGKISTEKIKELYRLLLDDISDDNTSVILNCIKNNVSQEELLTLTFQNDKLTILQLALFKGKLDLVDQLINSYPELINSDAINIVYTDTLINGTYDSIPLYREVNKYRPPENNDLGLLPLQRQFAVNANDPEINDLEYVDLCSPLLMLFKYNIKNKCNDEKLEKLFIKMFENCNENTLKSLTHEFMDQFMYLRNSYDKTYFEYYNKKILNLFKKILKNQYMKNIINTKFYYNESLLYHAIRTNIDLAILLLKNGAKADNTELYLLIERRNS